MTEPYILVDGSEKSKENPNSSQLHEDVLQLHPTQLTVPLTPDDVLLDQRQLLDVVLNPRAPIIPETVQLGPSVQNLNQALAELQPHGERDDQDQHRDNAVDEQQQGRPRRITRSFVNYKELNSFGKKR